MAIGSHLDITGTQEITDNFTITQKEFEKTKRQVIKEVVNNTITFEEILEDFE